MVIYVPKTRDMFLASRTAANKILENSLDLKFSDETINISTKGKKASGCPHRQYTIMDCTG